MHMMVLVIKYWLIHYYWNVLQYRTFPTNSNICTVVTLHYCTETISADEGKWVLWWRTGQAYASSSGASQPGWSSESLLTSEHNKPYIYLECLCVLRMHYVNFIAKLLQVHLCQYLFTACHYQSFCQSGIIINECGSKSRDAYSSSVWPSHLYLLSILVVTELWWAINYINHE